MNFKEWWQESGKYELNRQLCAEAAWAKTASCASPDRPAKERAAPMPPSDPEFDAIIHTDGACFPNPGPGAWAFVAKSPLGAILQKSNGAIPETTNNVAEWHATIQAMEWALEAGHKRIQVLSDSMLVVMQINKKWKVKSGHLMPLVQRGKELKQGFEVCENKHIRRELNEEADALAAEAMCSF